MQVAYVIHCMLLETTVQKQWTKYNVILSKSLVLAKPLQFSFLNIFARLQSLPYTLGERYFYVSTFTLEIFFGVHAKIHVTFCVSHYSRLKTAINKYLIFETSSVCGLVPYIIYFPVFLCECGFGQLQRYKIRDLLVLVNQWFETVFKRVCLPNESLTRHCRCYLSRGNPSRVQLKLIANKSESSLASSFSARAIVTAISDRRFAVAHLAFSIFGKLSWTPFLPLFC